MLDRVRESVLTFLVCIFVLLGRNSWRLKAQGQYAIFSATLFLQLHFNSFLDAHLVPDEVTPLGDSTI